MAKTNMRMPAELPDEAEKLLKQHDYIWDDLLYAFRKAREVGKQTTEQYEKTKPKLVTFEELSDHGLFKREVTAEENAAALEWLEQRLKSA